jgi:hypothetical protein
MFAVPMLLVYSSSLSGFYELRMSRTEAALTYLVPVPTELIGKSVVQHAEARPAFRGQWRVHVALASGEERQSALCDRESAASIARQIQALIVR